MHGYSLIWIFWVTVRVSKSKKSKLWDASLHNYFRPGTTHCAVWSESLQSHRGFKLHPKSLHKQNKNSKSVFCFVLFFSGSSRSWASSLVLAAAICLVYLLNCKFPAVTRRGKHRLEGLSDDVTKLPLNQGLLHFFRIQLIVCCWVCGFINLLTVFFCWLDTQKDIISFMWFCWF